MLEYPIGVITEQVKNPQSAFINGVYISCLSKFKILVDDSSEALSDQFGDDGLEEIRDAQFQRNESAILNG